VTGRLGKLRNKSFLICNRHQKLYGHQINQDEVGRTCSRHEDERCIL